MSILFRISKSHVGYGSIPIDTFLVGYSHPFTSHFDVNYRGTRVLTHPLLANVQRKKPKNVVDFGVLQG